MNLYAGTSGYVYKEWKGSFYPEKLPVKQMLRFYGERLRTVESNSTFRSIPDAATVKSWTGEVPEEFRFALKAPQQITHFRRLREVGELVKQFAAVAGVLKKRQGPILYQLPPNFKKDLERLKAFLKVLPTRQKAAIEFRHPTWFDDEVFNLLRKKRVTLCVAEADGDLVVPKISTTSWGYVRLRKAVYRDKDLKVWAQWVRAQPWSEAYVFFMHEETGNGPKYAARFLKFAE